MVQGPLLQQPYEAGIVIPILLAEKLELRRAEVLAEGHRAGQRQGSDASPASTDTERLFPAITSWRPSRPQTKRHIKVTNRTETV